MRGHTVAFKEKVKLTIFLHLKMPGARVFLGVKTLENSINEQKNTDCDILSKYTPEKHGAPLKMSICPIYSYPYC